MKEIAVFDTRVITALGDLNDTWAGLLTSKSGLRRHPEYPDMKVGLIEDLDTPFGTGERFSHLVDHIVKNQEPLPAGTSLVVATTKGAVDDIWQDGPGLKSSGQPWNCGEYIRSRLGLKKTARTISAACASGIVAVINGIMQILNGEAPFVLVLGFDLLSDFVISGFSSLKAVSPEACRPFDQNRDGLSLGEGIGAVLIGAREAGAALGLEEMAMISGWSAACDATHITAPSKYAVGLIEAIRLATNDLGCAVGGINAHGTGTIYNDAMEIFAFSQLWESPPPVHSIKGAIGHCLGAAGIIESAIAVKSLKEGKIPPTVGLEKPERIIANAVTVKKSVSLASRSVLTCNSGFGGINAVLLFS